MSSGKKEMSITKDVYSDKDFEFPRRDMPYAVAHLESVFVHRDENFLSFSLDAFECAVFSFGSRVVFHTVCYLHI